MRKAKYDLRKVICPNASCIGYSSNVAKPGYWIAYGSDRRIARVLGRIAETDRDGTDCKGWLAVIRMGMECTSGFIDWVNPSDVRHCYAKTPADFLTWLTGTDWVQSKNDIHRIIAMNEHGTLSDQFIATRNDPAKPYNARPLYVDQFILK